MCNSRSEIMIHEQNRWMKNRRGGFMNMKVGS